jgi:BspA type Leucine rich repeat region (6 copies)
MYAFYKTNITTINIPNSVLSIGMGAFSFCLSLSSAIMSNQVQFIGYQTFESTALTSIILPDSVIIVGDNAFYLCTSLSSVILGNSVIDIRFGAFANTAITTITIPPSVSTIGAKAFDWDVIIKRLTYQPTIRVQSK